jgi:hypothetical protein
VLQKIALFGCCLALYGTVAVADSAPAPAVVEAIRAGKFIDVVNGRALSNQVILIRNGKICRT